MATLMELKTMTFDEVHPNGSGPWEDEPDKAQWIDPATNLDCLAVRNRLGAWCGYVGLPPMHPLHGLGYDEVHEMLPELQVHGGLTFGAGCQDDNREQGVSHVPAPGRPTDVWWLGFDCAHFMDYVPGLRSLGQVGAYRTFGYVQDEVAHLAAQLDTVTPTGPVA